MLNKNQDLQQFIGSETIYCHWTKQLSYTEGVKYLAKTANAYWLIDAIASYQSSTELCQDPILEEFQIWKLQVNPDRSAILSCERDRNDIVVTQIIDRTDFPLSDIKLYLCFCGVDATNRTLTTL